MIEKPKKLMLPDVSGQNNHIPIAVNWNKRVANCQYVKFFLPQGRTAVIKKDHLLSVLFMIAKQEEQMRMMKRKIRTVRTLDTMVEVTATKNVQKGEKLRFPISIRVPTDLQDHIIEDDKLIKYDK